MDGDEKRIVRLVPSPPEKQIWTCDCGCEVFYLYDTGEVECAECESISSDLSCSYSPEE